MGWSTDFGGTYERSHPAIVAEVRGAGRSGAEYLGVVWDAALHTQHERECPFDPPSAGWPPKPPLTRAFRVSWAFPAPTRAYQHCPHDHLPEVYLDTHHFLDFDNKEEAVAQMRAWEAEARR